MSESSIQKRKSGDTLQLEKSSKSDEQKSGNCKCLECEELGTTEIQEHLSNIYAQLNEQSRLIETQNQTLSTLLTQLIPLLRSIDTKGQQTSQILFKLQKLNE
jgi:hypothetical protein